MESTSSYYDRNLHWENSRKNAADKIREELKNKEMINCTFAPDTTNSKKTFVKTPTNSKPNSTTTSPTERKSKNNSYINNSNISINNNISTTIDEVDILNKHITQLQATLNREKSRRESCEQELRALRRSDPSLYSTVSPGTSLFSLICSKIEELKLINTDQNNEIRDTFIAFKTRLDELELRMSRFINASDDKNIIESSKSHVASLTLALKASREKELKYIEINSQLLIQETNSVMDALSASLASDMRVDTSEDGGGGIIYKKNRENSLLPVSIVEEMNSLENNLTLIEKKLLEHHESSTLSYSSTSAISNVKLTNEINARISNLKSKHEKELESFKGKIANIEIEFLKGNSDFDELIKLLEE